jgi:ketosteroid isomerase-like protein
VKKRLSCIFSTSILLPAFCLLLAGCAPEGDQTLEASLQQLQHQVAELEAMEGIRDLYVDYGRMLDDRDFDSFATLYTDDAIYSGGGESRGGTAIAKQLEDVITANATGANLHIFTNEKIDVNVEAGTATATSRGAFFVQDEAGGPEALMFATYHDELVKDGGRWKFKSRRIVGDIPGPENGTR